MLKVGKLPPQCSSPKSKKDQPYLILWRDNFGGDVSIKLYDGNKLIQNISSRTASDGVYKWTPRIPVMLAILFGFLAGKTGGFSGSCNCNQD